MFRGPEKMKEISVTSQLEPAESIVGSTAMHMQAFPVFSAKRIDSLSGG
jgi:hypothetical protein